MNTHETYVSLEVAKLLKQAGFDWEVMSFYTNDITEGCESGYELRLVKFDNWNGKNKTWCDLVSAPTLAIAQRWLREVKHLSIEISSTKNFALQNWYHYTIVDNLGYKINSNGNDLYDYEEALEAGIKKCLTLLLKGRV